MKRDLSRAAAVAAALFLLGVSGCGGGIDEPPPFPEPANLSLSVAGDGRVEEAENPRVRVNVELDSPAVGAIGVQLNVAGTAVRGRDYQGGADSLTIPPNATSQAVEFDVYRDFEEEGDETIEVSISGFTGYARMDSPATAVVTVIDGEAAMVNKGPPSPEDELFELGLLPILYTVAQGAIVLVVFALVPPNLSEPVPLVAEWSTDIRFEADVHLIGRHEVAPPEGEFDLFLGAQHQFLLPLAALAPNGAYYLRAYLGDPPPPGLARGGPGFLLSGFATDADGQVVVRCEPPDRTPSAGGGDPLYAEQWHLRNTGQSAFSDRGGAPGADLRMATAIDAGRNGAGVKLAVVDSGLEICHPDLAANASAGGSFNFAFPARPGASPTDPFNFRTLGDHGTSVAGIAAAVANNGLGGRGVAPEVTLVGFNPVEAGAGGGDDPITPMMRSLGASERNPDSASVDIFNMSFGQQAPAENAREEMTRLFAMGTAQLRSGRGALYLKAAGNAFGFCAQDHPFSRELGCVNSNADPDHNLPWLVVVGGFNADDVKSSYSSAGANLWVVGPSGEDGVEAPAMITTDQAGPSAGHSQIAGNRLNAEHPLNPDGDYISLFGGTSSATPAVAGAVAILLGVNPELTWRDVKHVLAASARRIDPEVAAVRAAFNGAPYIAQPAWQTNAAGYGFHNWYGFGAVDVDAAVAMAAEHSADSLGAFVESEWFDAGGGAEMPLAIPDADGAGASAAFEVVGLPDTANIEAVVLELSVEHPNAFDLGVTLRSPAGTASVVNPPLNAALHGVRGLHDWRLLSNAFYGERPNGQWTLHVADLAAQDTGSLTGWRLRFYYGEHPAN